MRRSSLYLVLIAFFTAIGSLRADILTVGPGGMHATIQAAVDDAISRGGDHAIHIAEGTYMESLLLSAVVSRLELSGGWSEGFSNRMDDPALTIVSGGNTARVFDLGATTGQIRISNLTISDGFQDLRGAGLHVSCGDCVVELVKVSLHDNVINNDTEDNVIAGGSAVNAEIEGTGKFTMDQCQIRDNQITTNRQTARGTVYLALGSSSSSSATGEISNSTISENLGRSVKGGVQAAGLFVRVRGHSSLSLRSNAFLNNTIQATASGFAEGGAIYLDAGGNATYDVRGNEIRGNISSDTASQSTAPGALLWSTQQARGNFSDNRTIENVSHGPGNALGVGTALWTGDNSTMLAERNLWLGNIATAGREAEQLSLSTFGSSSLIVRDSVIADGDNFGIWPIPRNPDSAIHMTNLTVTGNGGPPVPPVTIPAPEGSLSIFNSIFFENGSSLEVDEGVETGNNLVDVDPLFRDAANQDYRLQPGSPALDAGIDTPPGGLGGADLEWNLRISGSSVDAGAYEVSEGPGKMQFLTQMGDGQIADIILDTEIDAANIGSQNVESLIVSFFDSAGAPWEINVEGQGVASRVAASLVPGESTTFRTSGLGEIRSGYARLESGANIGGTGIFTRTDEPSGIELYEAGVPLSEGLESATLFVDSLGDLETGLALVNVMEEGGEPAGEGGGPEVLFGLYDQQFNLLEETTRPLGPGQHDALFVSQLFPASAQAQEMQGVLTIQAQNDAQLAVVTLRQNDAPGVEFPDEVPTLAAFPVLPGGAVLAGPSPQIFYLAQIGNGQLGSFGLRTSLNFANTSAFDNNVHVDFFQSSGDPMIVTLEGFGTDSSFDFFLHSGDSVVAQTDGQGDIMAGYARVSTFEGVGGSAVFSQIDVPSGILETESGVPSSVPLTSFSIFVDTLGDSDTGLALVNPGTSPAGEGATIELSLFDRGGELLDQRELNLGAGQHTAQYVTQLFDQVDQIGEMLGLVALSSDVPVAGVTLKQNNDPLTSFPQDVATLTAFPVLAGNPNP